MRNQWLVWKCIVRLIPSPGGVDLYDEGSNAQDEIEKEQKVKFDNIGLTDFRFDGRGKRATADILRNIKERS